MSQESNPTPQPPDSTSKSPQTEKQTPELAPQSPQGEKPERQFVQKSVQAFIQWSPLGGSGWLFVHFLLEQDWMLAIFMFPVTVVTAIWAAYTESFIARMREIYTDRGKQDADSLVKFMESLDRALRWQLSGFEDKYLRCQANACRDYITEGFNQNFTPTLEEVFVPLELGDVHTMSLSPSLRQKDVEDIAAMQAKGEGLKIWDFLARMRKIPAYRRMVILAWGGYGKTTLLRHITYTYCEKPKRARLRYQVPRLIPFLLYLRKWRDLLGQENAPNLADLITQHHIPQLPEGKRLTLPANWVENLLRRGDALVMLDGFDEVAEGQRQQISEWISRQMEDYPKSVFFLTSRPGGYKDYSAATKPQTSLFVKPFNSDQRQRFIERWYFYREVYARAGRNTPEVKEEATRKGTDLMQQIEGRSELKDMAQNPLLLNMIATFHYSYPGNELPRKRTELYKAICQLQLGDRPLAKRIDLLLPAKESQEVLQSVALEMVQQNRPILPQNELMVLIETHLTSLDDGVQPAAFLEEVVKVSELLVEREPEEYEFAHLSFQNYLAAVQIKKLGQESLLFQHFGNSWWRETILLYAAQVNPTNLIREACNNGSHEAVSLAYDCWRETTRKVDEKVAAELELLAEQLRVLRYADLERYLQNGEWEKADKETYRLMISTVGKEEGQWFSSEDLLNFPCEELRKIDGLWVKYSNGRFGFSVQKKIYLECGGIPDGKYYNEAWERYCDRVGWMRKGEYILYSNYIFNNTSAPKGHLPYFGSRWRRERGFFRGWDGSLLSHQDL
jgi:hypothetical protein